MTKVEIISGILLLISSILIILVVLVQNNKDQGMTSAIGGGQNDSFYSGNMGNTRDAKLSKLTRVCTVIFFVVTLVVNFITYR